MNKLPEKTSDLILVALADLEKCEADPCYRINMNHWHYNMTDYDGVTDVCHVCLGGTVLAQTLEFDHWLDSNDVWHALRGDEHAYARVRIEALDEVRYGAIVSATELVEGRLDSADAMVDRAVKLRRIESAHKTLYRTYERSPEGFKEWLAGIATELKRAGH